MPEPPINLAPNDRDKVLKDLEEQLLVTRMLYTTNLENYSEVCMYIFFSIAYHCSARWGLYIYLLVLDLLTASFYE